LANIFITMYITGLESYRIRWNNAN